MSGELKATLDLLQRAQSLERQKQVDFLMDAHDQQLDALVMQQEEERNKLQKVHADQLSRLRRRQLLEQQLQLMRLKQQTTFQEDTLQVLAAKPEVSVEFDMEDVLDSSFHDSGADSEVFPITPEDENENYIDQFVDISGLSKF